MSIDILQTFIFNVLKDILLTYHVCVKVLSVAEPTVAQLDAFCSSDYL